ncbi:MAG: glycosyltransferase family 39 protein [Nanoarchaeota archaeon]
MEEEESVRKAEGEESLEADKNQKNALEEKKEEFEEKESKEVKREKKRPKPTARPKKHAQTVQEPAKQDKRQEKRPQPKNLKEFLGRYWWLIVLVLIAVFGTYLRFYHLDYPVIGYHNWKETHYLTEARNFARDGFFSSGFFVPRSDLPYLYADPSGAHPDTFPMISIIVGIFFKIFGPHLVIARLINLVFGVGTIIAMFFFIKKLFKRDDLALIAAFLSAISPLYIYFSHNVQLDNAGIFFMLMAPIFFLNWLEKNDTKNAVLACLFFMLAVLTKFTFAVIIIPILFLFPWKRLKDIPKRLKLYIPCFLILFLIPAWLYYANVVVARKFNVMQVGGGLASINLKAFTAPEFWPAVRSYLADNFGSFGSQTSGFLIGVFLAVLGILLFLVMMFSKKGYWKHAGNRFFIGYLIGAVLWFFIMAEKLMGHSYHQYPIAPLVILFISYLFMIIAVNIEKILKVRYTRWIFIILLCLLIYFPSIKAKDRVFDTQFIGLDVAGEYIKLHSTRDERIFHSSEQSYGVLWHADRIGYRPPVNSTEIEYGEKELNIRWIFLYKWGLQGLQNPGYQQHIAEQYDLAQVGFERQGQGWQPTYLLFKYGGKTNFSDINALLAGKPIQEKEYEFSFGNVAFGYIDVK